MARNLEAKTIKLNDLRDELQRTMTYLMANHLQLPVTKVRQLKQRCERLSAQIARLEGGRV